jgi:hypothetical protein
MTGRGLLHYRRSHLNSKQLQGELELAELRLAALRSGKRQPGSYGPPVSSGSGMKIAIDQQLKRINDLKAQIGKSAKKAP